MAIYFRKRSTLHLPVTISVILLALNVTLMVCWIVLLAQEARWTALTVGVVTFTIVLAGLIVWLTLSIKEIRLNQRQANFVDSVTHELKSPIAALQLSLETLGMRSMDDAHRREFHTMMADELRRLDHLISQLLEVGRLDAVGTKDRPENVPLLPLLTRCAEIACLHHQCEFDRVFTMDVPPVTLCSRRIVLQLVFSNLLDNAVKYSADPRRVHVVAERVEKDRLRVRITDNGSGVEWQDRKKIFRIFYRGGSELQRRHKGTGLGLYIVYTLVRRLKGRVSVAPRPDGQPGSTFEVELPGLVDDASPPPLSATDGNGVASRAREAEAVS